MRTGCGPTPWPRTRPAGCGSPRRGRRTSSARRCRVDQSHLIRQLPALRKGRRAWVIGDPDAPRSWAYLPDVAATLATLGTDERALGRAWHVPSNPPRSQRQALGDLAAALGAPRRAVSGIPWPVLRAVGVAVPMMREVAAMRHQFDQEFVIDASATTATFGLDRDALGRGRGARRPVPCR